MKREIKFRGKRIDNGEWVYGNYIKVTPYKDNGGHRICSQDSWDMFEVDPETVGQFTGLKDKNSVGVYEGDILRDEYGSGKVKWIMEHCAFLVFATNPSRYIAMESDGQLKNTEIIGNIYENPELLEVK